ncbi:MAG: hypothetical protein ACLFM4_12840 [Phormidium sp.]
MSDCPSLASLAVQLKLSDLYSIFGLRPHTGNSHRLIQGAIAPRLLKLYPVS